MKSKLSKIFVAIAMLLSFVAIPKVEVKANNDEQISPYSITVPVNATATHKLTSYSTPKVVITMSGTMVRGSDKKVTSYDLHLTSTPTNGNNYTIISVVFNSVSFAKSGTGVTGTYTIEVNYKNASGTVYQKTFTNTISCGV